MSSKWKKILSYSAIIMLSIGVISIVFGNTPISFDSNPDIFAITQFITLDLQVVAFLFVVGFIGGLVSGFIGSGGAFVLTPSMMSLGVPATVAVASNMCHKFPKAMVGAYKRFKYGQVDIKLGLIMAVSAVAGVLIGIQVQQFIKATWGEAGSNLYVSVAFIVVLVIVGGIVLLDARKISKSVDGEKTSKLAAKIQKLNIPPMIHFKTANVRISLWFTFPVGFATGMLAATIAVGGFIGVPGMMYVIGASGIVASATELVVAFVMGFGGTIKWALSGMVDIRLTLIILAGSLFGVQLGAIGTTYVKDYMIKIVMGTIMLIVAVSRGFAIPIYLTQLNILDLAKDITSLLKIISFIFMSSALATGAIIILVSLFKGRRKAMKEQVVIPSVSNKILVPVDGSTSSQYAFNQAISLALHEESSISAISIMPPYEGNLRFSGFLGAGEYRNTMHSTHKKILTEAEIAARAKGISIKSILEEGETDELIIQHAKEENCKIIVMGRKGQSKLEKSLMGSVTSKVIANCERDVLIVPPNSQISWKKILVPIDGSTQSSIAIKRAIEMAKFYQSQLKLLSVVNISAELYIEAPKSADELVKKTKLFVEEKKNEILAQDIHVDVFVREGEPYKQIIDMAHELNSTVIIMGSHGRTGVKAFMMGSVSQKVIGYSTIPVLIVNQDRQILTPSSENQTTAHKLRVTKTKDNTKPRSLIKAYFTKLFL